MLYKSKFVHLLALAITGLSSTLWSDVTGESVQNGQAHIARDGALTTITASDRCIIHYDQFNIASHETVQFVQPSIDARVYNKVLNGQSSQIDGKLFANGKVYLLNHAGIFFGKTAIVNVGSLFAAAGHLDQTDFINGIDSFSGLSGNVINEGSIKADLVYLLGKQVINRGNIWTQGGAIALIASDEAVIDHEKSSLSVNSAIHVDNPSFVENSGTIESEEGSVFLRAGDIYGLAIRHSGTIKAKKVVAESNSITHITGTIDTSTDSTGEKGGTIHLLGDQVGLRGGTLSANGPAGGGEILIGGDYLGKGIVDNAQRTYIDANSIIEADATDSGNGGKVIMWSETYTEFAGNVSAQGGLNGGNGGFVETSSKRDLSIPEGFVNTHAPNGRDGKWLLDPDVVNIVASGGTTTPPTNYGGSGTVSVNASAIVSSVANPVIINANNTITATTDINMTGTQSLSFGCGDTLTLQAITYSNSTNGATVTLECNHFQVPGSTDSIQVQNLSLGNATLIINTNNAVSASQFGTIPANSNVVTCGTLQFINGLQSTAYFPVPVTCSSLDVANLGTLGLGSSLTVTGNNLTIPINNFSVITPSSYITSGSNVISTINGTFSGGSTTLTVTNTGVLSSLNIVSAITDLSSLTVTGISNVNFASNVQIGTVTANSSLSTAGTITFANGGTLGSFSTNFNVNVINTLTINSSTFSYNGSLGSTFTLGSRTGTAPNYVFTLGSVQHTNPSSTLTFTGGTLASIANGALLTNNGAITVSSALNFQPTNGQQGNLIINSGNAAINLGSATGTLGGLNILQTGGLTIGAVNIGVLTAPSGNYPTIFNVGGNTIGQAQLGSSGTVQITVANPITFTSGLVLTSSQNATLSGTINTINTPMTFGGTVTLQNDTTLDTGTGTLTFQMAVTGATHNLSIVGGSLNLNQSLTAVGTLGINNTQGSGTVTISSALSATTITVVAKIITLSAALNAANISIDPITIATFTNPVTATTAFTAGTTNAGTYLINYGSGAVITSPSINTSIHPIQLQQNTTFSSSATAQINGSISGTSSTDLTFTGGGTFTFGTSTINAINITSLRNLILNTSSVFWGPVGTVNVPIALLQVGGSATNITFNNNCYFVANNFASVGGTVSFNATNGIYGFGTFNDGSEAISLNGTLLTPNTIIINNGLTLNDNANLIGTTGISLGGTITGNAHTLSLTSNANISLSNTFTNVSGLTVNSGGSVTVSSALAIGGNVSLTGTTITVSNPITTTNAGNVTINNSGAATVSSAINAAGSILFGSSGNITLSSNLTAGTSLTIQNGSALTGSAITLSTNDITLTTGTTLTDYGTIDGGRNLILNTTGNATFFSTIGGVTPIGTNTVTVPAILINSAGSTTFSTLTTVTGIVQSPTAGLVALTRNTTILNATVPTLLPGSTAFGNPTTLTTITSPTALIFGNNTTATTNTLLGNTVVTTSTNNQNITFYSTVNSTVNQNYSLLVTAGSGTIGFNGSVGAIQPLSALTTGATNVGLTILNAPIFNAVGGTFIFNTPVDITTNTTITDTGTTGVFFNSTVDSSNASSLSVIASGQILFNGKVGSLSALSALSANNTTGTTSTTILFNDTIEGAMPLTLASLGNITLQGIVGTNLIPLTSITIGSARNFVTNGVLNIRNFNQISGTGVTTINAAVNIQGTTDQAGGNFLATTDGTITLVNSLTTQGGTATSAGNGFDGGDVFLTSNNGSVIVQNITTSGSAALTSGNGGAAGSITLQPGSGLVQGGSGTRDQQPIGILALNGDLTAQGGALAGSGVIGSNGDVSLAALGRTTYPSLASIASSPTGNDITIISNNFTMGYQESFSTLGALTINATTSATLSDLNASGNISVDSPSIILQPHPLAYILRPTSMMTKQGLEINSGASINFSSAPTVGPTAGTPPNFFRVITGPNDAVLSAYFVTEISSLTNADLVLNTTVLDISFTGEPYFEGQINQFINILYASAMNTPYWSNFFYNDFRTRRIGYACLPWPIPCSCLDFTILKKWNRDPVQIFNPYPYPKY
ncbi:MAG: filamentous hemagglutinin N-terminal domain-containing protein [Parachlamydiales bacterium]|nr:filamentous hemagglutinin N-terminal domain-containing protein [Parachlamydiales bacterium]